jgi:predicted CXXCH cytochrome family protein
MNTRHLVSVVLATSVITAATVANPQSIVDSKHNLTRSGPGTVKAIPQIRAELCIFCHTPHKVRGKAKPGFFGWNREDSTASYTTYESSTMYATVDQPTGASKLCLSCHDGTIALGAIKSQRNVIPFQGDWENSPANLGTNLADDHPISFTYDSDLAIVNDELTDPSNLQDSIKLDSDEQLQCTTCHDPHDDTNGMFLVVSDPVKTLCVSCHRPAGWELSSHALSGSTWNGSEPDPWPSVEAEDTTVADMVCQNCHQPHNAGGEKGLLTYGLEEANCLKCHNGNVAINDIEAEIQKRYAHRVQDYVDLHDAGETARFSAVEPHVECVDCHDPHEAAGISQSTPGRPGSLRGVSGIDSSGAEVDEASFTYEVCFKCHADENVLTTVNIARQLSQFNTRLEFQESNPSAHAVLAPRPNQFVPSLLSEYTADSVISCTDCHGSDENTGDGGTGPDGPHGSIYEYLLVRNYNTIDNVPESAYEYALCYGCHDRFSILNDESFGEHDKHIRGEDTPCSVCHDPHGISDTQGNSANHQFLINFDINVVSPTTFGELRWEEGDLGPGSSRCYLACHGVEHDGWEDY